MLNDPQRDILRRERVAILRMSSFVKPTPNSLTSSKERHARRICEQNILRNVELRLMVTWRIRSCGSHGPVDFDEFVSEKGILDSSTRVSPAVKESRRSCNASS